MQDLEKSKIPSIPNLQPWEVEGIRVLAQKESKDRLFLESNIKAFSRSLEAKTTALQQLSWPSFDDKNPHYWSKYTDYYRSVIADTIQQLNYGKDTRCRTLKKTSKTVEALLAEKKTTYEATFSIASTNMLERAKTLAQEGYKICGFNPANNRTIGGGAFNGAPNYEEDLFRVSELSIALVQHAREAGDLHYDKKRPNYAEGVALHPNEALITTDVRVIKYIDFKPGNHWYAKEFKTLPEEQQFTMAFVSNAAIPLQERRPFTAAERRVTTDLIRAHLTTMIDEGIEIALLTDFGCGAFKNQPQEIAKIYQTLLFDEGYIQFFKGIEFTIINAENCNIFKQVFAPQLSSANKPLNTWLIAGLMVLGAALVGGTLGALISVSVGSIVVGTLIGMALGSWPAITYVNQPPTTSLPAPTEKEPVPKAAAANPYTHPTLHKATTHAFSDNAKPQEKLLSGASMPAHPTPPQHLPPMPIEEEATKKSPKP